MKGLILYALISIFCLSVHATTWYISPSGNDATGNGTVGNPWKTLQKASTAVTTSGDIIHVNAGTYVEVGTVNIAIGVSIEGDGSTSVIQSTVTAQFMPMVQLQSTVGTVSNQHISFIKIDGTNSASWGIDILGRSNVSVHDCTFLNVVQQGLIFDGSFNGTPAGYYATGNTCYNNTFTNSGGIVGGIGFGNLCVGYQDGMLVYNNTFTQNQRPDGQNGWGIKFQDEGHVRNWKVYNNTFTKQMITGAFNYIDFSFNIEMWNLEGGNEIYNNTAIGGGFDLQYTTKGASTYSVWVHDNNISVPTASTTAFQDGVILENEAQANVNVATTPNWAYITDVIIERNTFTNITRSILFTPRTNATVNNITIRNNLMINASGLSSSGACITMGDGGGGTINFSNVFVYNNTMFINPAYPMYKAITLPTQMSGGSINNIQIQNNIIGGSSYGSVFTQSNTIPITNLNISNNDFYGNATDILVDALTTPVAANNLHITPAYGANYTLQAGSPLIDAGVNVGLPFLGNAPDIGYSEFSSVPDTIPPSIISTLPASNATKVSINVLPVINFNKALKATTVNSTSVQLTQGATSIPATVSYNANTITIAPSAPLAINTVYTINVSTAVTNLNGNAMLTAFTSSFTTSATLPPTANAGIDQNITLPNNTVNLTGTATSSVGIATYLWTQILGPAGSSITNPNAAATSVTALTKGIYQFVLTVTDSTGATGKDTIQVTVNPNPVTANAGVNQTITLPINTVNLNGSGASSNGAVSYAWALVSGSAGSTITNNKVAATSVTGLVVGTYQFQLTVTDNTGATASSTMQVTVKPIIAVVVLPTANAGLDQSITLPVNNINLSGSGSSSTGTISAYAWRKISGPAAGTITNTSLAATSVTGLAAGIYLFELKVTDNIGGVGRDTMQLIVFPAVQLPIANAGPDQSITLPLNNINLNGIGASPNGIITSYTWAKISGPNATITNAAIAATSVTGLVAGIYLFELKVTDNNGGVARDTMQLTVYPALLAPVANAGLDQSITLPVNTASLNGSATDANGTITSYTWTKILGPNAGIIANASIGGTTVTGLTAGIYLYELKVTDNNGGVGRDTMQVTVNAQNIPPVANAGPNQSLVLPNNTATLTGSGTDADGTIVAYNWKQVAGPIAKITSPNTAVTVLENLIEAGYQFELTVTDNKGATGKDTVSVTVNAATGPSQNGLRNYPNPVVDITTLDINTSTANSVLLVTVSDVQGRTVYQKQITTIGYNTKEQLNMSNLMGGVYFITVYFGSNEKQTIRALKK